MITIKGKCGVQMSVSKVKCHLSTSTDSHQGVGGVWFSFLLVVYVDSSFDTRSRLFVAFCSLYVNICFLSKKTDSERRVCSCVPSWSPLVHSRPTTALGEKQTGSQIQSKNSQ